MHIIAMSQSSEPQKSLSLAVGAMAMGDYDITTALTGSFPSSMPVKGPELSA